MWCDYQVNPLFSLLLFVRAFHHSNINDVGTGSFPIQSTLRFSWAHTMTCMIPEEILVPLRFFSWGLGWEEIWSLIIASWTKAVSHMCIRPLLLPCSFAVYLYILAKPKCVRMQISGDLARASDNLQELQLACDRGVSRELGKPPIWYELTVWFLPNCPGRGRPSEKSRNSMFLHYERQACEHVHVTLGECWMTGVRTLPSENLLLVGPFHSSC